MNKDTCILIRLSSQDRAYWSACANELGIPLSKLVRHVMCHTCGTMDAPKPRFARIPTEMRLENEIAQKCLKKAKNQ